MPRGLAVNFSGRKLARARTANGPGDRGLSTAELARRVGTSSEQIDAYEQGRVRPEPGRIRALADALGVDPLELSDLDDRSRWPLAELRRAKGLRASDVGATLGMSSRSYRRMENEGIIPARDPGLPARVAAALDISVADLEHHLRRAPGLATRLQGAREPLRSLVEEYVRPGCPDLPGQDDRAVRALAVVHHRPAGTVARVIGHELVRIRAMRRRLAGFRASADFGSSADEQTAGRGAAEAEERRIERIVTALPHRMDAFFRCALPGELWFTLALLDRLPPSRPWLPAEHLPSTRDQPGDQPEDQPYDMPAHLVSRRTAPDNRDALEFRISEEGAKHCALYRPWYDAVYPEARPYLRVREAEVAGHTRGTDLEDLFADADALLLSFDGLLCRVFGRNPGPVSQHLIQFARSRQLSLEHQIPSDPVKLLRILGRQGSSDPIRHLDRLLAGYETEAARSAEPLPGISQLLHTLVAGNWRLAVVTDHASTAVEAFLERLDPLLGSHIAVFGRPGDPRLMKPHPHGLTLAAEALRSDRSKVVLLGESVADAQAAQSAGIPFVGVAATSRQARMLREAGATRTVSTVRILAAAARHTVRTSAASTTDTADTAPADQAP
ncbi:helix-turn-helix domain-containing protein [Streptomyces paludis]|uniref:Helix-turn-helix domain-containing protein n=1 Tax=Streptomyces paludis TaxID=2282738 RepID=A0A345HMG4_9ACTN|nr:helix-turn-helix domain-containing protein [Streptomyces paludis]AXG77888.1 helix-turn-helix domain-containing protein [Streptomyces paludis]